MTQQETLKQLAANISERTPLTPDMLTDRGWVGAEDPKTKRFMYYDPNTKSRDVVNVEFEAHYYRVWHGGDRTFIALQSSAEWLQTYLLLVWNEQKFEEPDDLFGIMPESVRRNKKFGL